MRKLVHGLHHITLVANNYGVNYRFYTGVLGLKQVKLSVNQDDVFHRHAFYANPDRPTGSSITFFEWPGLPRGRAGLGAPHHLAYRVRSVESLARWFTWLKERGVRVKGPYAYNGLVSLYFHDPDGVLLEIATLDEGFEADYLRDVFENASTPSVVDEGMKLAWFDHATPVALNAGVLKRFLEKFLELSGLETVKDDQGRVWLTVKDEEGVYLRYIIDPNAEYGYVGRGSIHHIAVAVESEEEQRTVLRRLNMASVVNSGIVDRFWFRSLYFRDPFGNLLEVATMGPGYNVDEPRESMGSRLVLPPWLEPIRAEVEARLAEQDSANTSSWPPEFSEVPDDPETFSTR
ncbi:MAG: VOC family protein [Candidatus Caldarchaeum sp.]